MWDKSSQSFARWALASLALGLAACSGGGGGRAEPAPSSTTTAAPVTTAPPATIDLSRPIPGGSLHGTPRPPLENTGDDYVAITESLITNFRWLTENPDPAVISELLVPGTPAHDQRIQAYEFLVSSGYHWSDDGYRLIDVSLLDIDTDVASMRVVDEMSFERLDDEAGTQVGSIRTRDPSIKQWNVLLARDPSGHWKIADWALASAEVEL